MNPPISRPTSGASNSKQNPLMFGDKIVSWKTLLRLRQKWRLERAVVVWTNGCFDLIHVGHVRSLFAAKKFGDILVVGVNSDASVRRLKGPERPVVAGKERMEMVAALACTDYVLEFDDLTPERVLSRLQPDVHCKGMDYAPPNGKPIPEAEIIRAYGGRIEFLPLHAALSTTAVIRSIQDRKSLQGSAAARAVRRERTTERPLNRAVPVIGSSSGSRNRADD